MAKAFIAAAGLLYAAVALPCSAQPLDAALEARYRAALQSFQYGRRLQQRCEYAVSDPAAYGRCGSQQVWHCVPGPCLNAVPAGVLQGAEYEAFIAQERHGEIRAMPWDIDKTAVRFNKGSLTAYCAFWQADCTLILAWYANPKNQRMKELLGLKAHP